MSFQELVYLILFIAVCVCAGYCTAKTFHQKCILGQSKADQILVEGLIASYATIVVAIIMHVVI